jgi:hypothetical protein
MQDIPVMGNNNLIEFLWMQVCSFSFCRGPFAAVVGQPTVSQALGQVGF